MFVSVVGLASVMFMTGTIMNLFNLFRRMLLEPILENAYNQDERYRNKGSASVISSV